MKNRVAWGLVAVLAAVVLGIAGLEAYGRRSGAFTLRWMPVGTWRSWWIGQRPLIWVSRGPHGWSMGRLKAERYSLGFVEVEVPCRGPRVMLWNTFPRPADPRPVSAGPP